MEMDYNQRGIHKTFKYLLLAFILLVRFQSTFAQTQPNQDCIFIYFGNEKIEGKISLNKKFWYTSIYFESKDQAISEYYYPHQLRGFMKGDSTFIVVHVNYSKFRENAFSRKNFALLLNDHSVAKLYKTYIPLGNGKSKEIFIYSKQGKEDTPVVIEDTKNAVLAVVSDCNVLKKDINQFGYEYSESYFRKLFENYNKWLKDSTATLETVSGTSVQKSDSVSASNKSSTNDSLIVSGTSKLKSDSISSSDTITNTRLLNRTKKTKVKSDKTSTSNSSATETNSQSNVAPTIDGLHDGDSILFELNGLYPGQFLNATKNGKCSIQYKGMGGKLKTQNVNSESVYKTSKDPENKSYYGYEIGENANIEVFVTKLNTKVLKPCTIIGLGKDRLIISYLTDDGKQRVLSVDKKIIK
jgi:hypothetical protein